MIDRRILNCAVAFLAASMVAWAQAPVPPVPPAPPVPPTPAIAPVAPLPPLDLDLQLDDIAVQLDDLAPNIQEQVDRALAQAAEARAQAGLGSAISINVNEQVREQVDKALAMAADISGKVATMQMNQNMLKAPMALAQADARSIAAEARAQAAAARIRPGRSGDEDRLYADGQRALDAQRWDQALDRFSEVAARGGARADGALYWKAYALNKLGRRDEALAAIADLRKAYASSRWLEDARALEVEVRQASGTNVAPESAGDDEIKLLALNGLMQTDPDRAFPILESLLKSAQSPRLKDRALFVLAQSSAPRAQQLLAQIARGGGNPDLQLKAIQYIGAMNRKKDGNNSGNNNQMLFEIYNASNDVPVKRAVLGALAGARDKDHLMQIAKSEKAADLRVEAIHLLGSTAAQNEIWQLYQAETSPEVKLQILNSMAGAGNTERLIEVARTEKDAKLRRAAIQDLSSVKSANTSDALVNIYGSEQDAQIKRSIIGALAGQRNGKALVDLGRKEKDTELKKDIVRHLVDMKSPDASGFLEEILK